MQNLFLDIIAAINLPLYIVVLTDHAYNIINCDFELPISVSLFESISRLQLTASLEQTSYSQSFSAVL